MQHNYGVKVRDGLKASR